MTSVLIPRNVVVSGTLRTSVRLEPEYWEAAREMCIREDLTFSQLVIKAHEKHSDRNRTSALVTYILQYYREAATPDAHRSVGHGEHAESKVLA